jgi:hypothetical protein
MQNLNEEVEKIEGRTLQGLIKAAIAIRRSMDKSEPTIPVDTGNLRHSYYTVSKQGLEDEFPGGFSGDAAKTMSNQHTAKINEKSGELALTKDPVVILGFSASYAWYVHEMVGGKVNWNRPGSGAKFFEKAIKQERGNILNIIQREARVK